MTKRRRVPEVLWNLFQNRARTLAETILSLIPPPPSATLPCRCHGSRHCLRCRCNGDPMSFLLREDDPPEYRNLLNHCYLVVSDNAPSPPPFDHHRHWRQLEIVRKTIGMILYENPSTKNVLCTGYSKIKRSSIIVEALTSPSWTLLLLRVGDNLMFYLLRYYSIFMPLNRKKHQQVAGVPINDKCWEFLKHTSNSKNQQPLSEKYQEVDNVSKNAHTPESSLSCHGCNVKDSVTPCHGDSRIGTDCSHTTQENGLVAVDQSGKRSRSHACRRRRKRRRLSSQNMCDTKSSLVEEEMKVPCSCCSVWKTLKKVPGKAQISKRSMLYNLKHASSVLPEKHIINSLKPNVGGANALCKEIFGLSDACIASQPTKCSHGSNICIMGTTCLYHSLHKLFKALIRKAIHCPRSKILNKHIFTHSLNQNAIEGENSTFEHAPIILDPQDLCCSKRQVVSFIWAVCRSIVPQELLGSQSNWRILRKNISKFIRLRIYEKFSLHQCMYKLKLSNFPFLADKSSLDNSSTNRNILKRWIYWLFSSLVVPLLQANFYITESEHGKLEVFFYEKSLWEKLMKSSISSLKDQCYNLLDMNSVKKILNCRSFGFSRVRFRPKAHGIRPLANLKSPSRLHPRNPFSGKQFKAVNAVLRDLHAALKDLQIKSPEKLGSSVFSYNDVHRNFRNFLSRAKNESNTLPCLYIVVADVQKAYDSIDQDKLLHVMKDVIIDDHILHQTHQIVASKGNMQICQYLNLSKQFHSYAQSRSSHRILVNQGIRRTARKYGLHFNLRQHVKYNVLFIDKRFYQQIVGIPQGSILSSLLCSFYFGHMENSKLVPFLDKVAESESSERRDLLLRFVDDFLYISTSKKQALEFFSRLDRGFSQYKCNMNKEKFGSSFDFDKIGSQSNRSYFDVDGNKFLRWSGLFINCKTLEVQADYTRYLDCHIRSTLTVSWQGNPGHHFREKLCDYLRPKCHAIFYDSRINSAAVVRLNIHQVFLLCAMKFHCYVCDLSDICSYDSRSYLEIIHNSFRFMYKLMKRRMYTLHADPSLRPILEVKKREVEWLGITAYIQVLKRKQSRYKELLLLLELKLKSFDAERVPPALKFAANKSNSLVLWKIKY